MHCLEKWQHFSTDEHRNYAKSYQVCSVSTGLPILSSDSYELIHSSSLHLFSLVLAILKLYGCMDCVFMLKCSIFWRKRWKFKSTFMSIATVMVRILSNCQLHQKEIFLLHFCYVLFKLVVIRNIWPRF